MRRRWSRQRGFAAADRSVAPLGGEPHLERQERSTRDVPDTSECVARSRCRPAMDLGFIGLTRAALAAPRRQLVPAADVPGAVPRLLRRATSRRRVPAELWG